jgi:hypothetical protein
LAPSQSLERDGIGQLLAARRSMRQHLDIDSRFVHLLDAQFAQVVQAFFQFRRTDHVAALELFHQFRVPEVFFNCNHLRPGLIRHDVVLQCFC